MVGISFVQCSDVVGDRKTSILYKKLMPLEPREGSLHALS